MTILESYLRKGVSACKKGFAYVKTIFILIKGTFHRMFGNGIYNVSFFKICKKWYCEVPGFPKELFEHTLMVGGASKFLDYHAKGSKRIAIKVQISGKGTGNNRLAKKSSTLTGGAFYNDLSNSVKDEIWLCPVTLILLGRYPKNIQILEVRSCMPPSEMQVRHILYAAIEHSLNDARKYFEDTIVAEYNKTEKYSQRLHLVTDFAESVGYDYQKELNQ